MAKNTSLMILFLLILCCTSFAFASDYNLVISSSATNVANIGASSSFNSEIGQSFQLNDTDCPDGCVVNYVSANVQRVSSPSDNISFFITDNLTTENVYGDYNYSINASLISTSFGYVNFNFSSNTVLYPNITYYVIAQRTGAYDGSNYVRMTFQSGDPYTNGQGYSRETAPSWVAITDGEAHGGDVNMVIYYFSVDATNPSISFASPIATTYSTDNITINISASDDVSVDTITLYNGSANITYTAPFSVHLVNGSYEFIAYVNDTSGNVNQTSVTFTVNTTSVLNQHLNVLIRFILMLSVAMINILLFFTLMGKADELTATIIKWYLAVIIVAVLVYVVSVIL